MNAPDPREDALAKQTTELCLKIGKYGMVCIKGLHGCENGAFETCNCKREPDLQAYRAIYEALDEAGKEWRKIADDRLSAYLVCGRQLAEAQEALAAPPSQSESDDDKRLRSVLSVAIDALRMHANHDPKAAQAASDALGFYGQEFG